MNKFILFRDDDKSIIYNIDKIINISNKKASYGKKRFHIYVYTEEGDLECFEFLTEEDSSKAFNTIFNALFGLQ